MSRLANRETVANIAFELAGSFLIAIATYNIVLYSEFPMSGFSGVALILYRLFGLPIGLVTILLNIPVALLCWRMIGRGFMLRSLRCMVINSLMIDYLAPLLPFYTGERMLAAIAAGVIGGAGFAMIYMRNSSTGGADFIIMAIKSRYPHIALGRIVLLVDVGVVAAGGLIFDDVDGIIYGIIINYLFAVVIDRVMYGLNSGKIAFIVTDRGEDICAAIDRSCGRGSTIIPARGGYSGDGREVVMAAGTNKDMYSIEKAAKQADPGSFMVVMESSEVHGEGFRVTRVAESE